jgi:hypothetical protein
MRHLPPYLLLAALLLAGRPAAAVTETLEFTAYKTLHPYNAPSATFVEALGKTDLSLALDKLDAVDPEAAANVRYTLNRALIQLLSAKTHKPVTEQPGLKRLEINRRDGERAVIHVGKATAGGKKRSGAILPGHSMLSVSVNHSNSKVVFHPAQGKRVPSIEVVVRMAGNPVFGREIPLEVGRDKARRREGKR